MPHTSRQYELVLLGATGYTGKLTAEWVSANLPVHLRWAVAGRNAKKLQAIADDLTKLHPNRRPPGMYVIHGKPLRSQYLRTLAIEMVELEKGQLHTLAKKACLIITTVGPYMFYGEPVLAACAQNGTHYLDCTGEVPWHLDMIAKYDTIAKQTGAIIIPQCGLDSVLADILSFVVTTHIRKTLKAPTLSVTMTLHDVKAGLSGGTASTALETFSHYSLKKLSAAMKPFSLSPAPPSSLSKPPTSSLFYSLLGLKNIPELGGVQTAGAMAAIDVCQVHRSWGLHEILAKDHSKPELSYGPNFRFTEYMRAKNTLIGAMVRFGFGLFGLLMAFPLTRLVLSPLIKRFVIPAPGEGPSKESMKNDFVSYRALGVADTVRKEKVLGKLDCAHGGYMVTGLTLSAAASVILRGDVGTTEARRLGGGIVTPAMLGEQYVKKLRDFGMKIEVENL